MIITDIQQLICDDFLALNQLITERLYSEVSLVNQLADHILKSGGKRLRPMLSLLVARAEECSDSLLAAQRQLAAIIEFIHTATLLHDDVVDESDKRRGLQTANAIWGNAASVLVGDYLYSRAFQMMTELNQPELLAILADTTNQIAEGEVLQLLCTRDVSLTEATYAKLIHAKTAVLFAASCRCSALLAGCSSDITEAYHTYGLALGMSFQLIDDVLDYTASNPEFGKNLGDDLASGKITLPLIITLQRCQEKEKNQLMTAIKNGDRSQLSFIQKLVASSNAIPYTYQLAKQYSEQARTALSKTKDNVYRQALDALIDFAINRQH